MTKADPRLLMEEAHRPKRFVIPGDGEKPSANSDPTIVVEPTVREITATTLADEHQSMKAIHHDLQSKDDAEDWGDGFTFFPEAAHVLRGPDGGIVSVVPLSEIPGVHFEAGRGLVPDDIEVVGAKPTPVPLPRSERNKLVGILATRMFKYYRQLPQSYPGYNPFRDGIPKTLSAGDPLNLAPHKSAEQLVPATDGEIHEWLKKFIGQRVSVVDKKRFGGGDIRDLALRIS